MTLTEKAAYLRGLCEGLELEEDKKVTKIINAIIDTIEDLAVTAADAEDELAVIESAIDTINDTIDVLDEDLADVESVIYDGCEGCTGCDSAAADDTDDVDADDDDDDGDDIYEIECPECGEVFSFPASALDDENARLVCPKCGNVIEEIEIVEDEDDE